MKSVLLLAALVAGFVLPTQAAANCAPRDVVAQRLADRYGETPKAVGLNSSNAVVEVFTSDITGTWTITSTSAIGRTCIVSSGQAFEFLSGDDPLPGEDS